MYSLVAAMLSLVTAQPLCVSCRSGASANGDADFSREEFRGQTPNSLSLEFGVCPRNSEVEAKAEFDDAAARIVCIRKIAVGTGRLTEAAQVRIECRRDPVPRNEQKEIRPVERVERLDAEFDIRPLFNVGLL